MAGAASMQKQGNKINVVLKMFYKVLQFRMCLINSGAAAFPRYLTNKCGPAHNFGFTAVIK
jgi:hypothetical protein